MLHQTGCACEHLHGTTGLQKLEITHGHAHHRIRAAGLKQAFQKFNWNNYEPALKGMLVMGLDTYGGDLSPSPHTPAIIPALLLGAAWTCSHVNRSVLVRP